LVVTHLFNATRNDKQTRLAFRMALSGDGGEPNVEATAA
jgi:hypothetical protein